MAEPTDRVRILLVDDNTSLLMAMKTTLEMLTNFTVVTAENGTEGLARYFEVQPHCVVIDVKMPGLDGYQLVRALRGDPASSATPLVILTAMVQEQDRFQGLAAGADQYRLKPIEPADLVDAIATALRTSAAERDAHYQQFAEEPPPEA